MSRNKQAKKANSRRGGYETESFENVVSKQNRRHTEGAERERANQLAQAEYEPIVDKVVAPLRALNEAQGQYLAAMRTDEIVFGVGPAGTGKSYVALSLAVEQLISKEIESIILTRPMVETGAKVGALPGTLAEKYSPYMMALISILNERLGKSKAAYFLKREVIQLLPLEFMRGQTFNDAVIILDEAQNSTIDQMQMFLTRIGKNSRVVVNGDADQTDLRGLSGLAHAVKFLGNIDGVRVCEFTEDDHYIY